MRCAPPLVRRRLRDEAALRGTGRTRAGTWAAAHRSDHRRGSANRLRAYAARHAAVDEGGAGVVQVAGLRSRPRLSAEPGVREPLPRADAVTTSHCCAVDREFDPKIARRELKRYRKRGPVSPTKELLELLAPCLPADATLLDIGGGVGMIHHELLDRGAKSAVQVDASSAYLAASEEEAGKRGHEGRVTFRHADFRAAASDIAPADVVTLDRVVCCDPDYESLLGLAAAHAKTALAFSYPRARWASRVFIGGFNAW